jgi:6-phosphofructokinase 1
MAVALKTTSSFGSTQGHQFQHSTKDQFLYCSFHSKVKQSKSNKIKRTAQLSVKANSSKLELYFKDPSEAEVSGGVGQTSQFS